MLGDLINETSTISKNSYDKQEYIKKKEEQRKWAFRTIDSAIEDIKVNSEFLKEYFNVQSRFDMYTPRNALLLTKQFPNVQQLKEKKDWIKMGVSLKNEIPKNIVVLEPGKKYLNKDGETVTPWNTKNMIDISETNSKSNTRSYDKKFILQSLIHISPLPIKAVDSLDSGKMCELNKEENVIYLCRNDNYDLIIQPLAKKIAEINLLLKDKQYDPIKVDCVAYMVLKKFEMDITLENVDKMILRYSQMNNKSEIVKDLSIIKDVTLYMNTNMRQYLDGYKKKEQVR